MKKIIFLHGFMGSPADADFLRSDTTQIFAPNITELLKDSSTDLLYDYIEEVSPDIIYGYSMGGRLTLDFLAKRLTSQKKKSSISHIILESSALLNLSTQQRASRQAQDYIRAKEILQNFPIFLKKWYELDLWGETSPNIKRQWIKRKEHYNRHQLRELSSLIKFLSPSVFDLPKLLDLPKDLSYIYIYGQEDSKYSKMMAQINFAHLSVEVFPVPNCGHNIHLSNPSYILSCLNHILVP